jgi:hypothetical protein
MAGKLPIDRVGVVCHSDDHKGRRGATRPGASTFGAIGGLTCYFMPELTRDALFEALRRRRHYGTTGTRLFMDLRGTFAEPVIGFSDNPQLGPAHQEPVREARRSEPAPRTSRSMCGSPGPTATKPGRVRSTSLHELNSQLRRQFRAK